MLHSAALGCTMPCRAVPCSVVMCCAVLHHAVLALLLILGAPCIHRLSLSLCLPPRHPGSCVIGPAAQNTDCHPTGQSRAHAAPAIAPSASFHTADTYGFFLPCDCAGASIASIHVLLPRSRAPSPAHFRFVSPIDTCLCCESCITSLQGILCKQLSDCISLLFVSFDRFAVHSRTKPEYTGSGDRGAPDAGNAQTEAHGMPDLSVDDAIAALCAAHGLTLDSDDTVAAARINQVWALMG